VLAAVDLSTLRVEDGSYVDPALTHRHSDLVLSARMHGERVYFYTLVEQQRDMEARMVLRTGQYMLHLWDTLARDPRLERLPPIIPIVIYNGRRRWTAPLAFQDLVAVPPAVQEHVLPHVPHFRIRLLDLHGGRMDDLVESALTALGRVVLWCLSVAGDDQRLEKDMVHLRGALDEVVLAPDAPAAFAAILRYLRATHPEMPAEKVDAVMRNATGPEAREVVVDIIEEFKDMGRQEGRQEGKQEGKQEALSSMLLDLLAHRFGPVPADAKKRILEADVKKLRRWALRVLDAASIQEVLGKPTARRASAR
jgi:predicted transposase YdaD